jgi:hypothetical protein
MMSTEDSYLEDKLIKRDYARPAGLKKKKNILSQLVTGKLLCDMLRAIRMTTDHFSNLLYSCGKLFGTIQFPSN